MRAVSPCCHLEGVSSLRTNGGESVLFPQRTRRVMPRTRMYSAKLWCLCFALRHAAKVITFSCTTLQAYSHIGTARECCAPAQFSGPTYSTVSLGRQCLDAQPRLKLAYKKGIELHTGIQRDVN